jgi:cytochrome c-type biogenesis protein CcmH/NrfF
VVLLVALALLGPGSAQPLQGQTHQDRPNAAVAEAAIAQLRSPYCPGLMLAICPSQPAALLRDSIYTMAADGATTEQIVDWMLANHGEEWRGVPQRSGRGLWAWVIPPLALAAGAAWLVSWLRNRRAVPAPAAPGISPEERDQLAQAMREWDEEEQTEA